MFGGRYIGTESDVNDGITAGMEKILVEINDTIQEIDRKRAALEAQKQQWEQDEQQLR
jgi:hypothetical protein